MDINCDCCELYCREGTRYTHIVRQDRQDVSAEQSDQKVRDRTLVLSTEEVLRLCGGLYSCIQQEDCRKADKASAIHHSVYKTQLKKMTVHLGCTYNFIFVST